MPEVGSQCFLCDLPVRFDTYEGCTHDCKYCFARAGRDISKVKRGEGTEALKSFINGKRSLNTKWCDWNIPLHWGGMSDPFQPCEKKWQMSKKCLEIFAETKYPFVVSTKGKLIGEPEYINLLKDCNCVVQISMVCGSYDVMEQGCPTFEERLEILRRVSAVVKRTIVRIQPYMHEVRDEVIENIPRFKEAGAYGIIIEGMKFKKKKNGLVKLGGDFVYPYKVIRQDFERIKEVAHANGLSIYAGENRLRELGDSLTCCGIDGLEGFVPNTYNISHMINGDITQPTPAMAEPSSAHCFRALYQNSRVGGVVEKKRFDEMMPLYMKEHKERMNKTFGKKY